VTQFRPMSLALSLASENMNALELIHRTTDIGYNVTTHHGLHGSANPRVNGDRPYQREMAIFDPPPQNPHPLTDHQKTGYR